MASGMSNCPSHRPGGLLLVLPQYAKILENPAN